MQCSRFLGLAFVLVTWSTLTISREAEADDDGLSSVDDRLLEVFRRLDRKINELKEIERETEVSKASSSEANFLTRRCPGGTGACLEKKLAEVGREGIDSNANVQATKEETKAEILMKAYRSGSTRLASRNGATGERSRTGDTGQGSRTGATDQGSRTGATGDGYRTGATRLESRTGATRLESRTGATRLESRTGATRLESRTGATRLESRTGAKRLEGVATQLRKKEASADQRGGQDCTQVKRSGTWDPDCIPQIVGRSGSDEYATVEKKRDEVAKKLLRYLRQKYADRDN